MTRIERILRWLAFGGLAMVIALQLGIWHGRRIALASAGPCTAIAIRVTATAYTSRPQETDDTPFTTATGTPTRVGVLAVSRDLLELLPYGTTVYVVEDTMHPRWERRIDFWMPDYRMARRFGRHGAYLEIADPSTGRRYFLRVPPTIQQAREVVAWTFNMAPDAWRPQAET